MTDIKMTRFPASDGSKVRLMNAALAAAQAKCDRIDMELAAIAADDQDAKAKFTSLVETCKLNDVDPLAYLTDALARIVNGHPNSDIDQLLPWAYGRHELKAVA